MDGLDVMENDGKMMDWNGKIPMGLDVIGMEIIHLYDGLE